MEVQITKAFKAVPEGEIYPFQYEVGDVVSGEIADVAIALGCASAPIKKATERGGKP